MKELDVCESFRIFYLKFCITLRNLSCAFLILRKVRLNIRINLEF